MTPSQPSRQARSHGASPVERRHPRHRQRQRQRLQDRPPLVERQRPHVAAVDPQDVEDVVVGLPLPAPAAGRLAVEDQRVVRQRRQRLRHRRIGGGQRQAVARPQLHPAAALEGEHADAIELALEGPRRIGEPVGGERRRHRLEPVGERHRHARDRLRFACAFTNATYLSIQPWRNFRVPSLAMAPDASKNPSLAVRNTSGCPSVGMSRYASMVRRCCWAHAVPICADRDAEDAGGLARPRALPVRAATRDRWRSSGRRESSGCTPA